LACQAAPIAQTMPIAHIATKAGSAPAHVHRLD
jgi:hypothetical protein